MNKTTDATYANQTLPQPGNLRVLYNGSLVGALAQTQEETIAFEYGDEWLARGFSISPLSLPLEKRVFISKYLPFEGLHGVFDNSLPDGWGRLLVDRLLQSKGYDPVAIRPLTRLSIVGASGMGALTYEPQTALETTQTLSDLDTLAAECAHILNSNTSENLDELFRLGGSSGGARPKILTTYEGEDWLIKFPSSYDQPNVGKMEYEYALAALQCGIDVPEVRLFPSKRCEGYFGVRRFDRLPTATPHVPATRIHTICAGALLETSHRIPNLDYHTLMLLTLKLTNDYDEVLRLYRLMCFNVFAHNRDDHARNFSYLHDPTAHRWRLSPAYDLTCNPGMHGEHATTINGKGTDITLDDLLAVADKTGLSQKEARSTAQEVQEGTQALKVWSSKSG
ncbi:MAG: type II toxin-antitoxin system HipA family toxin [Coriobacteriales bacterium]|jgi:serine/threonine-protein kinase HipA|nr:type II toxin-antitoxin system HipA family toxin [Coriobacteriales bacterium]